MFLTHGASLVGSWLTPLPLTEQLYMTVQNLSDQVMDALNFPIQAPHHAIPWTALFLSAPMSTEDLESTPQ
jgi:hypothetical protein